MGSMFASYNRQQAHYYDKTQGPLPGATLWERFGGLAKACDPYPFALYDDDFLAVTPASNTIPGWTFTNSTSGTVTQDTTNPSGLLVISAGAATANQGVNFQFTAPSFKIAADKPVAFEAFIKFTGLSNLRLQTFVGLAASSTAVIASGAMAAIDRVGFQGITTTGVLSSVARGGGTAVTGTGVTLANSTFYRLGFFATSSQIDFYVNGAIVSSIASQIPTGGLCPTVVIQANGTDTPVGNLDYVRCAGFR